jgi:hypothetical protein
MQQNFQQQIERERQISDDWREVATNNTDTLSKLTSQTDRLLEGQKTVETFILSLPRAIVGDPSPREVRQLRQGPGGSWQ